jgi:hypothetical protein
MNADHGIQAARSAADRPAGLEDEVRRESAIARLTLLGDEPPGCSGASPGQPGDAARRPCRAGGQQGPLSSILAQLESSEPRWCCGRSPPRRSPTPGRPRPWLAWPATQDLPSGDQRWTHCCGWPRRVSQAWTPSWACCSMSGSLSRLALPGGRPGDREDRKSLLRICVPSRPGGAVAAMERNGGARPQPAPSGRARHRRLLSSPCWPVGRPPGPGNRPRLCQLGRAPAPGARRAGRTTISCRCGAGRYTHTGASLPRSAASLLDRLTTAPGDAAGVMSQGIHLVHPRTGSRVAL